MPQQSCLVIARLQAITAVKLQRERSDYVALPEMFLCGYQAQDLVLRRAFVADCQRYLQELAEACADGPALGIGAPMREGHEVFNCYFVLQGGKIAVSLKKHHLPHTHVFDEHRFYEVGPINGPYRIGDVRVGSPICEDAWHPDVCEAVAESGAEILVIPNGSPYYRNKFDVRMNKMVARVVETELPLVFLNLVGAQDDQVFDGASFVLNPGGGLAVQLPQFEEAVVHVDFEETADGWRALDSVKTTRPDEWEADYFAMVLGLRDYFAKTGFKKCLLGLSGGIDSAIVAAIASDALGPENVRCVMMPSEYTSEHSLEDAKGVADLLGCKLDTIPISEGRTAVMNTLEPFFEGTEPDVTEENIQSRLRGLFLMALSNKTGEMLLTTGNKSEVAVGYATIYGDMAGGYNPIKDLYKMRVFETCRWRNANHRNWMKGPEGELREDQKDEDSLPPYEVLDAILERLVDREMSIEETVADGYDEETVRRVEWLIYISEYKRFQSAPGVRLTQKAFWLDRRYPIVNRWRDGK